MIPKVISMPTFVSFPEQNTQEVEFCYTKDIFGLDIFLTCLLLLGLMKAEMMIFFNAAKKSQIKCEACIWN